MKEQVSAEKKLGEEKMVRSGIDGLDEVLGGGFDAGNIILLAGSPGSGKSVAAAQFIYNGAVKYGEAGLYLSFNESRSDFLRNMARLGMDFQRLEEEGMFRFIDACNVFNRRSLDLIFSHMLDELASLRVRRMVIDSVNAIVGMMDHGELRGFMATTIIGVCKVSGITCILIGNLSHQGWSNELVELSFMCDLVIRLEAKMLGDVVERFLVVEKAKGRRLPVARVEYVITDRGLSVFVPTMSPPAERKYGYVRVKLPELDGGAMMREVKRGSITLISGESGLGKKYVLVEFAASGVLEGEKTLYVTFSDLSRVKDAFERRGYSVRELEERGLRILSFNPSRITPGGVLLALKDALESFQPERVAVEDASNMKWLPGEEYRRLINEMAALFKSYGVTVMMSSACDAMKARETDEFRVADNVVAFWSEMKEGGFVRRACTLNVEDDGYGGKRE